MFLGPTFDSRFCNLNSSNSHHLHALILIASSTAWLHKLNFYITSGSFVTSTPMLCQGCRNCLIKKCDAAQILWLYGCGMSCARGSTSLNPTMPSQGSRFWDGVPNLCSLNPLMPPAAAFPSAYDANCEAAGVNCKAGGGSKLQQGYTPMPANFCHSSNF